MWENRDRKRDERFSICLLKTGEMLEFEPQRVSADTPAGVEPSLIKFSALGGEMAVMQLSVLY